MAKILVVDDQLSILHLLDLLNGYEVRLAESGRMGLELYRREYPDVVVLGPNVPEMDGITVLEEVRKLNLERVSAYASMITSMRRQSATAPSPFDTANWPLRQK